MTKIIQYNNRQHMINNIYEIFWYKGLDNVDKNVDLHHHDFYEIYLFISGDVKYIVENHNYHLIPGDILLISPSELHQPIIDDKDIDNYERIVIWVNKQILNLFKSTESDLVSCFDSSNPYHTNLLRLSTPQRLNFQHFVETLLNTFNDKSFASDLLGISHLIQVMVELNRFAMLPRENYEIINKSSDTITEILAYINKHYTEKITLDSIADKFFLSKYYLSHEFKELVGTSLYNYIIQKRLLISKQMLADGTPPSKVYQNCGFGDYANFYRAFKSTYGMSPKEYLALLKSSKFNDILI